MTVPSEGMLQVTDSRTGRSYDIPITNGVIHATDLRQIKSHEDDYGLLSYDPAFLNTANCRSSITYIDGEKGILRYRGYPIEELAEQCSFLQVAYLLLHGELPNGAEAQAWADEITHHTFVHENVKGFINGFHHDAHPMGMLVSTVGTELSYHPDPVLERAVDALLILHADHEQNCSTTTMRTVGSAHSDPYSSAAAAAAALYGPLHGGANEQVLKMLTEIGSVSNVPAYIDRVKSGELRLMGFGHRVYKNFDPRATIIKEIADQVFKVTGRNRLLDIALELEKIALADEYFVSHRLYPNVDFYSGIIYQAMGFPVEMFPVLFAIGRTPGWLAQWEESILDPEQRIVRPRQIYVGSDLRHLGQ